MMVPVSFYRHSFEDLALLVEQQELPSMTPRHLYKWYYRNNNREFCDIHNLSKKTKSFLRENFSFELPHVHTVHQSQDRTVKFLFKLQDGKNVETVLIPFQGKYTICLSSQVGCAMNCSFCFTGTQGFSRHLAAEEIVGQFLEAKRWLTANRPGDDRILNIVYMGQGEPLHNFDEVKKSAEIFLSRYGLSIAAHKITISTSGYIPGLERWKKEMPDVNLALSLHSPFTEKRNQLIPINRKFPLDEVMKLVEDIPQQEKRFVTYEYLVLKGFNDSEEDAHATGRLLQGKKAYINLIPFNPYPGSKYQRPDYDQLGEFKNILDTYQVPTLIRTTKGDDILAACGQLNTATH